MVLTDCRRIRHCLTTPCVTMSCMTTLTVRVPDDLKRELKRFSKQHGQTAGDVIRNSLKRYLAVERFQALRAKTLPFAEAQGFLTDEDVFKALGTRGRH